jgi:hypothetical protein
LWATKAPIGEAAGGMPPGRVDSDVATWTMIWGAGQPSCSPSWSNSSARHRVELRAVLWAATDLGNEMIQLHARKNHPAEFKRDADGLHRDTEDLIRTAIATESGVSAATSALETGHQTLAAEALSPVFKAPRVGSLIRMQTSRHAMSNTVR